MIHLKYHVEMDSRVTGYSSREEFGQQKKLFWIFINIPVVLYTGVFVYH